MVCVFLVPFLLLAATLVRCWICGSIGCSNNNYASREKCKKCGQPKEVAAMPAMAVAGASVPTHAYYFARTQGGPGLYMNQGLNMNQSDLQQALSTGAGWPLSTDNNFGLQTASSWSFGVNNSSGGYLNNMNQLLVAPKGWKNGDWICNCGFHNYSSRAQCKKCNASMPSGVLSSTASSTATSLFPALGTKRVASEEFVNWDSKRLNAGDFNSHILTNGQQVSYEGFAQTAESNNDQTSSLYAALSAGSSAAVPNLHMQVQLQQMVTIPAIVGKGYLNCEAVEGWRLDVYKLQQS